MRKIFLVVGARPNFMKAAPLCNELKKNNTERPITIKMGLNRLVSLENLVEVISEIKKTALNYSTFKQEKNVPHLWDGNAAYRISRVIEIKKN